MVRRRSSAAGAGSGRKKSKRRKPRANGPAVPEKPRDPFLIPDDELIIEELAERIAREVEARPPACLWCVATLANGSAFCSPTCQEDYHRKLMPRPFARSRDGSTSWTWRGS